MNDNGTVNRVVLAGEVGCVPRWCKYEDDRQYLCFVLITKEKYLQNGHEVEHKEEHDVRIPENKTPNQLKPGQWVHIEGKIKTFSLIDEQSIKHYKTEIFAVKVQLLGFGSNLNKQAMANSESDQRQ